MKHKLFIHIQKFVQKLDWSFQQQNIFTGSTLLNVQHSMDKVVLYHSSPRSYKFWIRSLLLFGRGLPSLDIGYIDLVPWKIGTLFEVPGHLSGRTSF